LKVRFFRKKSKNELLSCAGVEKKRKMFTANRIRYFVECGRSEEISEVNRKDIDQFKVENRLDSPKGTISKFVEVPLFQKRQSSTRHQIEGATGFSKKLRQAFELEEFYSFQRPVRVGYEAPQKVQRVCADRSIGIGYSRD